MSVVLIEDILEELDKISQHEYDHVIQPYNTGCRISISKLIDYILNHKIRILNLFLPMDYNGNVKKRIYFQKRFGFSKIYQEYLEDGLHKLLIFNSYTCILRTFITSCMSLRKDHYKYISEFCKNGIVDVGAGSGYHDAILKEYGVKDIYALDIVNSNYDFVEFFPVEKQQYDFKRINSIAVNGGCLLYIWPTKYSQLNKWFDMGGKWVIIVGNFYPSHTDNVFDDYMDFIKNVKEQDRTIPRICPIFPPKNSKKYWKLHETKNIGSMICPDDVSVHSTIQIWKRV